MRGMRTFLPYPAGLCLLIGIFLAFAPSASALEKTVMEGTTVTLDAAESFDVTGAVRFLWENFADNRVPFSSETDQVITFVTPRVRGEDLVVSFHLTVWWPDGSFKRDTVITLVKDNGIGGYPYNALPFYTSDGQTMGIMAEPERFSDYTPHTGLVSLATVEPASITVTENRPGFLVYGLIGVKLRCKPGAYMVVDIWLEREAQDWYDWFKFVRGKWEVAPEYVYIDPDRKHLTMILKDGGQGDNDGLANGVIVDPSGLGALPTGDADWTGGDNDFCFMGPLQQ